MKGILYTYVSTFIIYSQSKERGIKMMRDF